MICVNISRETSSELSTVPQIKLILCKCLVSISWETPSEYSSCIVPQIELSPRNCPINVSWEISSYWEFWAGAGQSRWWICRVQCTLHFPSVFPVRKENWLWKSGTHEINTADWGFLRFHLLQSLRNFHNSCEFF